MIKKLRKVGNSNALLLDKAILEMLGMHEGSKVNLTIDGGSLIVTPVEPTPVSADQFNACLDRVMTEWGDVLRRLA